MYGLSMHGQDLGSRLCMTMYVNKKGPGQAWHASSMCFNTQLTRLFSADEKVRAQHTLRAGSKPLLLAGLEHKGNAPRLQAAFQGDLDGDHMGCNIRPRGVARGSHALHQGLIGPSTCIMHTAKLLSWMHCSWPRQTD